MTLEEVSRIFRDYKFCVLTVSCTLPAFFRQIDNILMHMRSPQLLDTWHGLLSRITPVDSLHNRSKLPWHCQAIVHRIAVVDDGQLVPARSFLSMTLLRRSINTSSDMSSDSSVLSNSFDKLNIPTFPRVLIPPLFQDFV